MEFSNTWRPTLFVGGVLAVVAAFVLWIDVLLIDLVLSFSTKRRALLLLVAGAITGVLPRVTWGVIPGDQGLAAFIPQFEFLAFAIPGAVFMLVLARLTRNPAPVRI